MLTLFHFREFQGGHAISPNKNIRDLVKWKSQIRNHIIHRLETSNREAGYLGASLNSNNALSSLQLADIDRF